MKKTYIQPSAQTFPLSTRRAILAQSGGVATGSTTGNEFNGTDVTYTDKQETIWDYWEN